MARRSKTDGLFPDLSPKDLRPDPPGPDDLADDERAILRGEDPYAEKPDVSPDGPAEHVVRDYTLRPEKKRDPEKKKRPPRDPAKEGDADDRPLVERVRVRAGKSWLKRIKLYEDILNDKDADPKLRMMAAAKLDDLSIGKAPTAAPLGAQRRTLLFGNAALDSSLNDSPLRQVGDEIDDPFAGSPGSGVGTDAGSEPAPSIEGA